ncbi:Protein phosphatase 2C [Paenibacillus sp. yr247]|uniref:protein phosphatase 2C domain-containing protein n=1 Tax=Paenibacillus sp. yr247 TaxID=1761880 RepID=UPI0008920E45|nr:protein phosphatase 2C domain-containing protein [Paenibacillus sp. yr247]SDM79892.1 Protein phosphatase 2C [Paenibacillus sp. yr247]
MAAASDVNVWIQNDWLQACSIHGVGEFNEDVLVINEKAGIFGVIDGATAISNPRSSSGESGGYVASRILASAAEHAASNMSLKELVLEANLELRQRIVSEGIDIKQKEALWAAAFVLFKVNETTIEFAQAGDCMLYARYINNEVRTITRDQVRPFDRITLQKRVEARRSGLSTHEEIMEYVKPYINLNRNKTNTLEGYSVFNGEIELENFIETGTINRAGLINIYALTDGLLYPDNDEAENNVHGMLDRIDQLGLQNYALELIAEEEQDLECVKNVRHKISDDKTGIVLDLSK